MLRNAAGLLIVASLCACRGGNRPSTQTDVPAVRYIIDSLNNRFVALIGAGQADSASTLFASDVWQMPPNMMPLVGRDSLRTFWTNMTKSGKVEFDLQTQDVIAADSIAVERGSYNLKFTAGRGAPMPSFVDHGNYVVFWRQDSDGHWRIVWDAPVSTVPMPTPPPPPRPR
jgi:ketosteroid isomerase-like protein